MELNELKNMIYNFVTFSEILQAFKLCLLENLSSYINHHLQQVDKKCLVNGDEIFVFSLPDPAKIWLSTWLSYKPDGNCNWITTSYVNHCFNLFLVSKLFVLLSVTP